MKNNCIYIEFDYEISGFDSNQNIITTNKFKLDALNDRNLYRLLYYSDDVKKEIYNFGFVKDRYKIVDAIFNNLDKKFEEFIIRTLWLRCRFKLISIIYKEAKFIIDEVFNATTCLKDEYLTIHNNDFVKKWVLLNQLPTFFARYLYSDKTLVKSKYGTKIADEFFADVLMDPKNIISPGRKNPTDNSKCIKYDTSRHLSLSERHCFLSLGLSMP